jgi:two-component system, sensor histidine kinase and response regulator
MTDPFLSSRHAGSATQAAADVLVLAVDDRQENLDVLDALLRHRVTMLGATSGDEALELLLTHDFALALIDVNMPEMGGFELAELMRGSERSRGVPIIFLTATAPERLKVFRGYEAGAVDFLFKPLDARLLESKVDVFIELFRQRQRLAAQVEQHRQLVRTAELLMGVMGHDLRTPLSAIVTAGETLRLAHPDDQRLQQIGDIIGSASRRMSRLIGQLLDFATARLGGMPVRPQPADLSDLCHAAMLEFEERGSALTCRANGDLSGVWDPDRIVQVVSNLIANAVTHGAPGGAIEIRLDGDGESAVELEVSNDGEIHAEALHHLFAPFAQTANRSGTGLGLFIVDHVVRAHGGTVEARSANGQTTFRVALPRQAPHGAERTPVPAVAPVLPSR